MGLALAPPSKVTRSDGSSVVLVKYTNIGKETVGILKLFINPLMLALLPMCFTSNFFYSYQFDNINGALFNIRTRGFNNMFYWGFQMVGAYLISLLLDTQRFARKTRGFIAFIVVFVVFNAIWGGSLALHNKYPKGLELADRIDFKETHRAAGPIILYLVCGIGDALYQSFAYWIIGALSNDNQLLARYAGFYKGMQSFGAAIAWQLAAKKVSVGHQLIANWVLFGISIPSMLYVLWTIKDHSEDTQVKGDIDSDSYHADKSAEVAQSA
ncbi:hypothetical protein IW150_006143 [Coemansia sp. RSA 2607]|nr:hypothetical protein IW150_006143 [Coemansia sp. RSA 2607]KAJ2390928.1 hypothetical protein GGI05_003086 [Coemansia sp. RSA 2603]